MSIKTALEKKKLAQEKQLKEEELDVQDKSSKRALLGNVIGSVSSLFPRGKYDLSNKATSGHTSRRSGGYTLGNGPIWYKKFVKPIEAVTNIPTWIKVSKPKLASTAGESKMGDSVGIMDQSGPDVNYYGVRDVLAPVSPVDGRSRSTIRVVVHRFMPHLGVRQDGLVTGHPSPSVVGVQSSEDYPINRATLMTITQLGKVNSRPIDNDVSIPGLYFLSGTEVYAFLAELKFVIDTAMHYQHNDNTIPRAIISAKGYDYDEVVANLAEYRKMYIVLREYALSNVPLPDNLTLLARRLWMNTVVIRDTSNEKGLIVLFAQEAFGRLSDEGDSLEFNAFNISSNTYIKSQGYQAINAYLGNMINRIASDEEFLTFISNMRAAGMAFAPISELDSTISYEIDANDEVKLQLQNIVTLPGTYTNNHTINGHLDSGRLSDWKVWQDSDGKLTTETMINLNSHLVSTITGNQMGEIIRAYLEARCLSKYCELFNSFDGWDSDKMLVATRLHPLFSGILLYFGDTDQYGAYLRIASCGTEIVINSEAYFVDAEEDGSGGFDEVITSETVFTIETVSGNMTKSGTTFAFSIDGIQSYPIGNPSLLIQAKQDTYVDLMLQFSGMYPVIAVDPRAISSFRFDISNGTILNDAAYTAQLLCQTDDYIYVSRRDLAGIHEASVLSEYYLDSSDFKGFFRK